ncbi:21084_t:CDS:2, partial [Gigaspora margarita]
EFYKINDININPKKTKLIVFNPRVKRESCEIMIAKEMVKAEEKNTLQKAYYKPTNLYKQYVSGTQTCIPATNFPLNTASALQNPAALFKVFKKQDRFAKNN